MRPLVIVCFVLLSLGVELSGLSHGRHCVVAATSPTGGEASPPAGDPLSVVGAWVEGHRAAHHDIDLLTFDAVLEVAGAPPVAGAAQIVTFLDAFYGAVGDREVTIETAVASGAQVAGLLRITGVHAGPLLGVPPTGNEVDFWLSAFAEVRDGKIARIRAVFDAVGLLSQIGAIPAPATPAARSFES